MKSVSEISEMLGVAKQTVYVKLKEIDSSYIIKERNMTFVSVEGIDKISSLISTRKKNIKAKSTVIEVNEVKLDNEYESEIKYLREKVKEADYEKKLLLECLKAKSEIINNQSSTINNLSSECSNALNKIDTSVSNIENTVININNTLTETEIKLIKKQKELEKRNLNIKNSKNKKWFSFKSILSFI